MTKILTVDDDRHILTSLSVILQAEGFEVKAFSDGASALDAFSRLKPDLAVIDIKMPEWTVWNCFKNFDRKVGFRSFF